MDALAFFSQATSQFERVRYQVSRMKHYAHNFILRPTDIQDISNNRRVVDKQCTPPPPAELFRCLNWPLGLSRLAKLVGQRVVQSERVISGVLRQDETPYHHGVRICHQLRIEWEGLHGGKYTSPTADRNVAVLMLAC